MDARALRATRRSPDVPIRLSSTAAPAAGIEDANPNTALPPCPAPLGQACIRCCQARWAGPWMNRRVGHSVGPLPS